MIPTALGVKPGRHDVGAVTTIADYGGSDPERAAIGYLRNVHLNLIARSSRSGMRFKSLGRRRSLCHARFQTMKISLPGLTVQRSRVLLPRFCESVSY